MDEIERVAAVAWAAADIHDAAVAAWDKAEQEDAAWDALAARLRAMVDPWASRVGAEWVAGFVQALK